MALHIEDYALIGDLRTAALIGVDGTIAWLSLPRFDSPAVYAAILGDSRHGQWELAPVGQERSSHRRYRTDTLVLESLWTTSDGVVRVTDLMAPGSATPTVIRIIDGLAGTVLMRTHIAPRMGYGKDVPAFADVGAVKVASSGAEELRLSSDIELANSDGAWTGTFTVSAGERRSLTLSYAEANAPEGPILTPDDALASTTTFWTEWVNQSTYTGSWATEVKQSLIVLKALTYAPTGSILAAATTSLPEELGGSRNWDYRFVWLRDATFTLQAFLATGFLEEARAWRDWLVRTVIDDPTGLQVMYAVDGSSDLSEHTIDWLPGHAQSTPVRVGNAAATQRQNDVWGEVLDFLWTARDAGLPDAPDQEKLERALLDQIETHWRDTDHGLWEVRGPQRHFLHSKLLAWVGVDRAVRTLEQQRIQEPVELERLMALRLTIAQEISARGFHPRRRAFTQSYGSPRLDAAVLLIPRYGLLRAADPRMIDTVEAIQRDLTHHGLVQRYAVSDDGHNIDGLPGGEGTFLATSFWLADALHGMGRTEAAEDLFERLLSLRNDVGLLSEEYDPASGRQLGNTPQAFSHASLITTALTLQVAHRTIVSAAAPDARGAPRPMNRYDVAEDSGDPAPCRGPARERQPLGLIQASSTLTRVGERAPRETPRAPIGRHDHDPTFVGEANRRCAT